MSRGAALLAGDAHDDALIAAVRPPGWTNPPPRNRYHIVVVGAGTGGLVAAAVAAGLGATVALVEGHLMGGDCLNAGCVPSKALVSAARAWHAARAAASAWGGPAAPGDGDFAAVMNRVRRVRSAIAPADGAARFREFGVDVFLGHGSFTAPDRLRVGDAVLSFRRAVIATGARPAVPRIPGLEQVRYLTNESVFTLTERPTSMAVLGGGPIGCELAQAFQRLGVQVTLLEQAPRLMPRDDAEAAALVAASLKRDGVRLVLGADIGTIEQAGQTVRIRARAEGADTVVEAAQLLVATGRRPNTDGLGVEPAGIAVTDRGITVDDRLRTTNPRVYAVGDVCSELRFTHAADFQARLVVQNALFYGRRRASDLIVPWCTYTAPEVAQVGLTELEARGRGIDCTTVTVPLAEVDRARLAGEGDGFAKLVLSVPGDRILGATLVAASAGDLISEVAVAMTNGLGLAAIGRTMHPYPTTAEIWRKAADQFQRRKLTPTLRTVLSAWFKITH